MRYFAVIGHPSVFALRKRWFYCPNTKLSRVLSTAMIRILNVAEKNDAAKSLSDIMSSGRYSKREGLSKYNKIYEFPYRISNQNCTMVMTSVSGHLLTCEFVGQYKKWRSCNPVDLFGAAIAKQCPADYNDIKKTLEREIRNCQSLIVWTDCDREGENIGFEIIQVCTAVKPDVKVYRARFSEITPQAVNRAVNNLTAPHRNTSDAVDVRQELDLRIGAAFTRFQTLRLQKVFPTVLADQLISYGSCQFPTLGFVVERYKQVQAFVPEPFWKIQVTVQTEGSEEVEFNWKRQRLFDYLACLVLYQHCLEKPEATVKSVTCKPKSKWRPVALDTVELEKTASRKLRINAKETMRIAEHLYTQGYISYPRTETNCFPKDFDLQGLIQQQTQDSAWGAFASNLLVIGPMPRNGNKSDQAHPPIHPTKYASNLQGNEKTIYDFIVRHFLACCSRDAVGQETTVEIDINNEQFSLSGLMIIERNYLDVYPYDKWTGKVIPVFQTGQVFLPKAIEMNQGETSPPSLLTEADLIALMEKHGIGTDATHAEHIETIKSRLYVGVRPDGKFVPGELGMGLVEGYDAMGYEMSKPHLRAELEADLKKVCEGRKDKNVVLAEQIEKYKAVFIEACKQANKIDESLAKFFGNAQPLDPTGLENMAYVSPTVRQCPHCQNGMVLKRKKDNTSWYASCLGYPDCRHAIWFPSSVVDAVVDESVCSVCGPGPVHKIKFTFKRGSVPAFIPLEYVSCIGGCDPSLSETLGFTTSHSRDSRQTPAAGNHSSNQRQAINNSSSRNTFSTDFCNNRQANDLSSQRQALTTRNGPNMLPSRGNARNGSSTNWRSNSDSSVNGRRQLTTDSFDTNTSFGSASAGSRLQTPVCQCGEDARIMAVKKEGPNTGRQFYSCARTSASRCGFFLWADSVDSGDGSSVNRQQSSGSLFNNSGRPAYRQENGSGVTCKCDIAAKLCTVVKDGPNKGRPFYGCTKPRGQGCNFFSWADENDAQADGQSSGFAVPANHRHQFQNSRGRKRQAASSDSQAEQGTRARRKCGVCGEEGHTRKNCPHSSR